MEYNRTKHRQNSYEDDDFIGFKLKMVCLYFLFLFLVVQYIKNKYLFNFENQIMLLFCVILSSLLNISIKLYMLVVILYQIKCEQIKINGGSKLKEWLKCHRVFFFFFLFWNILNEIYGGKNNWLWFLRKSQPPLKMWWDASTKFG